MSRAVRLALMCHHDKQIVSILADSRRIRFRGASGGAEPVGLDAAVPDAGACLAWNRLPMMQSMLTDMTVMYT
jgi:hypothetical protein